MKFTDQTFAVFNNLGDDGQLKGTSLGKKPSPCRKSPSRSPRPRAIGATGGCEADFIGLTQAIFANVENGTNLPDHTVVLTPTHQKGLAINRSPMPEEGSFTRAILDAAVTPKAADVEVPRDQVNSKSVVSSPSFEFSSGSFNLVPKRATPKKQAAVPRQLQQSFDFSDIQSKNKGLIKVFGRDIKEGKGKAYIKYIKIVFNIVYLTVSQRIFAAFVIC